MIYILAYFAHSKSKNLPNNKKRMCLHSFTFFKIKNLLSYWYGRQEKRKINFIY
jgi:hypothetical protein